MSEKITKPTQEDEPWLPKNIEDQVKKIVARAISKEMAIKIIDPKSINCN